MIFFKFVIKVVTSRYGQLGLPRPMGQPGQPIPLRFVDFFGPVGEVPNGDTVYGASHPRHVMLDPTRPAMLAALFVLTLSSNL